MIEHLDEDTNQLDPTERLMAMLMALSNDEDPTARDQALTSLAALPDEFWDDERIEGTIATLTPVADEDLDDSTAFTIWTLMASLLARYEAHSDERPADAFHDTLSTLLEAKSPEIRGFAASVVAQATVPEADTALIQALTQEKRWDVAIRLITGLSSRNAHVPLSDLLTLLKAPTEEAITWSARQIGEQSEHEGRKPLYNLLRSLDANASAISDAISDALGQLDQQAAWTHATQLAKKSSSEEALELKHFKGRHLSFRVLFEQNTEAPFSERTSWFRLHLNLPSHDEGPSSETAVQQFAAPLACAATFPIDVATFKNLPAHSVQPSLSPLTASAPYQIDASEEGASLRIALVGQPPSVWLRTLMPLVDRIHDTLVHLDQRSKHTAPPPDLIEAALDDLQSRLHSLAERRTYLGEQIDGTSLQGGDGSTWLLTHTHAPGGFPSIVALDLGELTTTHPEQGLLLEVHLPSSDADDLLQTSLCDVLAWKFNLTVQPIAQENDPGLSKSQAGHTRVVLKAQAPKDETSLPEDATIERLTSLYRGLLDFATHLSMFCASGLPLWEALGLPEPELRDRLPKPVKPVEVKPLLTLNEGVLPLAPKVHVKPKNLKDIWADVGGFKAPAPPDPTKPKTKAEKARALHEAQHKGDAKPTAQNDLAGFSPADVIKSLGANIELADVYLRTSGYNHKKLAQIMTLLLEMSQPEAMAIIEQAPCMIRSGVPRDRARTIRRVLEGTGAKIAVTRHGETM